MKRHIPGLHPQTRNGQDLLEGTFLVRVERAFYRWHPLKPFYVVRLTILEPKQYQDHSLFGRLYCTPRALWKLNWFLQEFGYDSDLLGRDEIDEKAVVGLRGIVRVSHTILNGHRFLNLEGFAAAGDWEEVSPSVAGNQVITHDL
jgi:hypothetical protein